MSHLYKRGIYGGLRIETLANLPPLTTPYYHQIKEIKTYGIAGARYQISDSEFATPHRYPLVVRGRQYSGLSDPQLSRGDINGN